MAAQHNNNNPNFTDLNFNFSAATVVSHNVRALGASDPNSHSKSLTRTFLKSNTVLPLNTVDLLLLQETGRIWVPQILLRPDFELAAYSVDDNNAFASIATYYCHRRWRLLEAEVLVAGRLSLHLLESKTQATKLLTFNVYGPAGADQESKRLLDKILNTILEKIRLVKQRHPLVSCYIAGDFNVNLNDESLPKSRALRSFAAAGQLTEMTADLPATWRGVRGNTVSFSKLDHIFTDNVARLEAGSFPNPDSDHHVIYVKPFPKEKIRDPDPPPSKSIQLKFLKEKQTLKFLQNKWPLKFTRNICSLMRMYC